MGFLADLPPVPVRGPRPLPFLGPNGNFLRFFGDPIAWMTRLRREYGAIAALSDRSPAMVCAFGAEHNRQILSDPGLFENNERLLFSLPEESPVRRLNQSLVLMNGEAHRRQRRLMMPAFQRSVIDGYRDGIVDATERALSRVRVGETVDVAHEMLELTLGVAMRCLFGVDVEQTPEDLGRLGIRHLEGLTSLKTILFPFPLPGTPFAELVDVSARLEAKLRELIRAKRREDTGQRDAVSLLVRARDDDGSTLTEDELVGQCSLLFIAGHETTSHTLTWTLFLLDQHPRVLADVCDEIDAELRGAPPTAADVERLRLVDAVIKESMRLLPATPMAFMRFATRDFQLGPYAMPKGSGVIVSPYVSHRAPDLYADPQAFRPERWAGLKPTPYEFLPFGAGPRMCAGAGFASLALRIMLPMILQRFRLALTPEARVSRQIRGITLGPKYGMPMRVHRPDRAFSRGPRARGDIHEMVALA